MILCEFCSNRIDLRLVETIVMGMCEKLELVRLGLNSISDNDILQRVMCMETSSRTAIVYTLSDHVLSAFVIKSDIL